MCDFVTHNLYIINIILVCVLKSCQLYSLLKIKNKLIN